MKIIGKNSLLYWLRIPFAIYVVGFILSSLWIFGLMFYHAFTQNYNSFITNRSIEHFKYDDDDKVEKTLNLIEFKYPFTKMCVATENTAEGIVMAFLGLLSFSFILFFALKIVLKLSNDQIFSAKIVRDFKFLGYGLICFGIIHIIVDLVTSVNRFDISSPFFYILTGLVLIFLKEIFYKYI